MIKWILSISIVMISITMPLLAGTITGYEVMKSVRENSRRYETRLASVKLEIIDKKILENTIELIILASKGKMNLNNKETQKKISSIGRVDKIHDKGSLYKYIAGKYNSLSKAEFRKSEVVKNGFTDAFIYAEKDGQRITVKEAERLLE